MALILITIMRTVAGKEFAGQLGSQILSLANGELTKDQLFNAFLVWSSQASDIANTILTSTERTAAALGRFLQNVVACVPSLGLILSCFGNFRWLGFSSTTGGKRIGGATRSDGKQLGGGKDGNDDGGGKKPPPDGSKPTEPEDAAENKLQQERQAELERIRQDLEAIRINGVLGQPNQEAGPLPVGGPVRLLREETRNQVEALLEILEHLVPNQLGYYPDWTLRGLIIMGGLTNRGVWFRLRARLSYILQVRLFGIQATDLTLRPYYGA